MANDNSTPPFNPGKLVSFTGGKGETPQPVKQEIPQNPYVITDIDDQEYFAEGFLLFTQQHVAVMRDHDEGALPVLMVPMGRVKAAELVEDDESELPF